MTAAANLLARLAALHPSDRQWLLSQTSAELRARLAVALGSGQAASPRTLSARETIASATPDHVVRALQTQPAWLATALLRMDQWPWSAALLKRMPALQRAFIGQPASAVKPALAAAILKSFARSLALIEASGLAPGQRLPPFEALLQRLRGSRNPQESGF